MDQNISISQINFSLHQREVGRGLAIIIPRPLLFLRVTVRSLNAPMYL